MKNATKSLVKSAVIAAVYAITTLLFYPLSFSGVQIRVSEAMTLLPLVMPEAVLGLTVGCLISNLFGNGPLDVIFGTLATLSASLITYFLGKTVRKTPLKLTLGAIPPVVVNAFVVPLTYLVATELKSLYLINVVLVGAGQLISVCGLGIPLYFAVRKRLE